MKSRPLTPADADIWQKVARTIRPLDEIAKPSEQKSPAHIHLPPAPAPRPVSGTQDLQIRADKKVRKGRLDIDVKIDLHDLTRDQAFPVLVRRLTRAHGQGQRCVLVVTGKGTNLEGVLRRALPAWLMDEKLRPLIASFAPAHTRHGGTGAFYVFLKRKG